MAVSLLPSGSITKTSSGVSIPTVVLPPKAIFPFETARDRGDTSLPASLRTGFDALSAKTEPIKREANKEANTIRAVAALRLDIKGFICAP
jgi:hypothetical protein